jgi:hypothetical protein
MYCIFTRHKCIQNKIKVCYTFYTYIIVSNKYNFEFLNYHVLYIYQTQMYPEYLGLPDL